MQRLYWIVVFSLLLASCSSSISAPPNTGIEGQVLIGPTCPVMIEGMDCADKPFAATISVMNAANEKMFSFQTDAEGKFKIALPPGDFILHPEPPQNNMMPFGRDVNIAVIEGQFTQVTLYYDSGIR